jgi:hypothetical protein
MQVGVGVAVASAVTLPRVTATVTVPSVPHQFSQSQLASGAGPVAPSDVPAKPGNSDRVSRDRERPWNGKGAPS